MEASNPPQSAALSQSRGPSDRRRLSRRLPLRTCGSPDGWCADGTSPLQGPWRCSLSPSSTSCAKRSRIKPNASSSCDLRYYCCSCCCCCLCCRCCCCLLCCRCLLLSLPLLLLLLLPAAAGVTVAAAAAAGYRYCCRRRRRRCYCSCCCMGVSICCSGSLGL